MNDANTGDDAASTVVRSASLIGAFVKTLTMDTKAFYGNDRRCDARNPLATAIVAMPCDRRGTPTGDHFEAVTRDISQSGLALLHGAPVADKLLRIEFHAGGQEVHVVLEVLRCRQIGPIWEIAGRFLMDPSN